MVCPTVVKRLGSPLSGSVHVSEVSNTNEQLGDLLLRRIQRGGDPGVDGGTRKAYT